MTPTEAVQILSAATEPQNLARMTRLDYVRVHEALQVLAALVEAAKPQPPPADAPQ